jgi:shikimate 5-dehydrogenase
MMAKQYLTLEGQSDCRFVINTLPSGLETLHSSARSLMPDDTLPFRTYQGDVNYL